ncbi:hypothetical protein B0H14DRAFT_3454866 [Mycena olivaceomarginata]|nr:hypothetical protein B0H14DRAFT_3454866 [Mycena olivaceomarginata]
MSAKTRAVELLNALQAAIDSIPPGVVAGTRHGLLAKCLTPKLSDDDPPVEIFPYDTADGAYNSFSTQAGAIKDLGFDGKRDQFPRPNPDDTRDLATCNGLEAILTT